MCEVNAWPVPLMHPTLARGEIHIWKTALRQPQAVVKEFESWLSPDELQRAGCFVLEGLRRNFVVARGMLRVLLSRYLQCSPGQIHLAYGPFGKPEVVAGSELSRRLQFNLAHSHELAVFAFTLDDPVGIDLEWMPANMDVLKIASRFFSTSEKTALSSLSAEDQPAAFFQIWTSKEAFIKAIGEGFRYPLESFSVSMNPGQGKIANLQGEMIGWMTHAFSPQAGYAAALAVQTSQPCLQFWSGAG